MDSVGAGEIKKSSSRQRAFLRRSVAARGPLISLLADDDEMVEGEAIGVELGEEKKSLGALPASLPQPPSYPGAGPAVMGEEFIPESPPVEEDSLQTFTLQGLGRHEFHFPAVSQRKDATPTLNRAQPDQGGLLGLRATTPGYQDNISGRNSNNWQQGKGTTTGSCLGASGPLQSTGAPARMYPPVRGPLFLSSSTMAEKTGVGASSGIPRTPSPQFIPASPQLPPGGAPSTGGSTLYEEDIVDLLDSIERRYPPGYEPGALRQNLGAEGSGAMGVAQAMGVLPQHPVPTGAPCTAGASGKLPEDQRPINGHAPATSSLHNLHQRLLQDFLVSPEGAEGPNIRGTEESGPKGFPMKGPQEDSLPDKNQPVQAVGGNGGLVGPMFHGPRPPEAQLATATAVALASQLTLGDGNREPLEGNTTVSLSACGPTPDSASLCAALDLLEQQYYQRDPKGQEGEAGVFRGGPVGGGPQHKSPFPIKQLAFTSRHEDESTGMDVDMPVQQATSQGGAGQGPVPNSRLNATHSEEVVVLSSDSEEELEDNEEEEEEEEEVPAGLPASAAAADAGGAPTSFSPQSQLSSYLPNEVCMAFGDPNRPLYQWQAECLQRPGVLHGRNLVYCAPTSGGKSLVADILVLRRLIMTGRPFLVVLPFVALCAEKANHLEKVLAPLKRTVKRFYGGSSGGQIMQQDTGAIVCTIEKANILMNKMLEEESLHHLGAVVVDELHMVGDDDRGYLLELMLTKLRYATHQEPPAGRSENANHEAKGKEHKEEEENDDDDDEEEEEEEAGRGQPEWMSELSNVQIIGMSATMSNTEAVSCWLGAELYQTTYRPVTLVEYLKVGRHLKDANMNIVRELACDSEWEHQDPDHVALLTRETVEEGHSVLIFCASKATCETAAKHIARTLVVPERKTALSSSVGEGWGRDQLVEELKRLTGGADPSLVEVAARGVAFHHAGLTQEERELVELGYRTGALSVLTATSTLAAGVNMPARRVILRHPYVGLPSNLLDSTRYRQMTGRAGRAGIDTEGESILLATSGVNVSRLIQLMQSPAQPIISCLTEDKRGMKRAMLEVVASNTVMTPADVEKYIRCTLLAATTDFQEVVAASCKASLRWLCQRDFIQWNPTNSIYEPTALGKGTLASGLPPEDALLVRKDLLQARNGLVLSTDLHMTFLITPLSEDLPIDWHRYYDMYNRLSEAERRVAEFVGVRPKYIMDQHMGSIRRSGAQSEAMKETDRVARRFYQAMILNDLVQEMPVADAVAKYGAVRGALQGLQERAAKFAAMISAFCERLGWHDMEALISRYQGRVSSGVRPEIVALTEIPHVKGHRARLLYKAGLRTPEAVAASTVDRLLEVLMSGGGHGADVANTRRIEGRAARLILQGAKELVAGKATELEEQVRTLLAAVKGESGPPAPGPIASMAHTLGAETFLVPSAGPNQPPADSPSKKRSRDPNNTPSPATAALPKKSLVMLGPSASTSTRHCASQVLAVAPGPGVSGNVATGELVADTVPPDVAPAPISAPAPRQTPSGPPVSRRGIKVLLESKDICMMCQEVLAKGRFSFALHLPEAPEALSGPVPPGLALPDMTSVHVDQVKGLQGVALCLGDGSVYYAGTRHGKAALPGPIQALLRNPNVVKVSYGIKEQLRALLSDQHGQAGAQQGLQLLDPLLDVRLMAWMMDPGDVGCVHEKGGGGRSGKQSACRALELMAEKKVGRAAVQAALQGLGSGVLDRRVVEVCRCAALASVLDASLEPLLHSEGLLRPLVEVEMPLVKVLVDMELKGMALSPQVFLRQQEPMQQRLKQLEAQAHQLSGINFPLSNPQEVARVLFDHLKLPPPPNAGTTARGGYSTKAEVLVELQEQHPIVRVIMEHRRLSKLLHGFITPLKEFTNRSPTKGGQREGATSANRGPTRIFGRFLQAATATGRLAMDEPNLQCIPKPVSYRLSAHTVGEGTQGGEGAQSQVLQSNIRSAFVAGPGCVLMSADYSQLELRLMAHFSHDTILRAMFVDQQDPFATLAARWQKVSVKQVTGDQRNHAKKLAYGLLYGMGPVSLSSELGVDVSTATFLADTFKRSLPGVDKWMQEVVVECRQRGYVQTLSGRKRFLPEISQRGGKGGSARAAAAERQAVNTVCQGSAADLVKCAMVQVYERLRSRGLAPQCVMLLQIHDELLFEVQISVLTEAAELVKEVMETSVRLTVPLNVKLHVGPSWGELEPYETSTGSLQ